MNDTTSLLEGIRVAKPCTAKWEEMSGDERVRRCALCKLDVYDLSAMGRDEAEAFVAARAGAQRTCVRFFRRADGTVLTQDCPVGLRAAWRRTQWAAAALLAAGFTAAAMFAPRWEGGRPTVAPMRQIYDFVQSHFGSPVVPVPVMGDVAAPSPPPQQAPAPTMGRVAAPEPARLQGEMTFAPGK